MKITGACHCEAITYEAVVDPNEASICHCTDCQALSGTAFRLTIRAEVGSFRLLSGTPRIYTKTAESGSRREQAFCERCGSSIYATSPASGGEPRTYSLRAGTIRERAQIRPGVQIWARSQLPWVREISSIPSVDKQRT